MAWVNAKLEDIIPVIAGADHELETGEIIAGALFRDGLDTRAMLSGLMQNNFGSKIGILGVFANEGNARDTSAMHLDASIL